MVDLDTLPTNIDIERYRFLSPMLDSALHEMREFSKKKQDGIVSDTKIKILNRLLADLKAILRHEASSSYLELLSEQGLPQNGDAVLILGQYRAALDSFKARHLKQIDYKNVWLTKEWYEENEEDDEEYDDDDEPEAEDELTEQEEDGEEGENGDSK